MKTTIKILIAVQFLFIIYGIYRLCQGAVAYGVTMILANGLFGALNIFTLKLINHEN